MRGRPYRRVPANHRLNKRACMGKLCDHIYLVGRRSRTPGGELDLTPALVSFSVHHPHLECGTAELRLPPRGELGLRYSLA